MAKPRACAPRGPGISVARGLAGAGGGTVPGVRTDPEARTGWPPGGGQPPARSALGLRLALALFGLVFCAAAAVVAAVYGPWPLAAVLAFIALTAAVDIRVISRHRRRRREAERVTGAAAGRSQRLP